MKASVKSQMTLPRVDVDLIDDGVHDPGGEQNLAVGNRYGSALADRTIKGFNEILDTGIRVEVSRQEQSNVAEQVADMLLGKQHRRNEVIRLTVKSHAANPQ